MGRELRSGGYIDLLLLISVCEQVLYMNLQGVSGSNALLASFFSALLIILCPLFSGLPEAEGRREEATWRLGREVHLGFSSAEMKNLCFLDYPPLLPTHGRRGGAPSPSPVCTRASSSVDEGMPCLTRSTIC